MTIVETIKEEINNYEKKIKEYMEGIVDPNIRGIRAIMGVYPERQKEKYMLRIKTPAGKLSLEQFEAVSRIADKYSHGKIHFTTRQDIQFQGVELEDTVKIMRESLELGIDTLGAGGNSARNIACSPLSGVAKDEVFDVTPHALKAAELMLNDSSAIKLPRKYKVTFSNNSEDTAYATIADLGFIAKIENGKRGFEVYGGGGLGGSPTVSLKLSNFIEEKDVLYYVYAMKELFFAEGDRENRSRARIRFIVYRLGEEKFKELFEAYLKKARQESNLELLIEEEHKSYEVENSEPSVSSQIITEQKQKGYYSIYVHTENGYIDTKDIYKVLDYIKSLNYEVSIRLTNTQGFYIRDIKGKDVDPLVAIVKSFSTNPIMKDIISCVGETVCGTGLCNSQGLASAIYKKFEGTEEALKSILPKIYISGCPNSCGQHQIGKLGFSGRGLKGADGMIPAYRVFFGGIISAGKTALGEVKGDIPAKRIPEFIYELAVKAKVSSQKDFDTFVKEEWSQVQSLIEEFGGIQESADLYYDFASNVKFLTKK